MFNIPEKYLQETWERNKSGKIDLLKNFERIVNTFISKAATSLLYEEHFPGVISMKGIETMENDLTEVLVYCALLAYHWGQEDTDILSRIQRYTTSLNMHD